MSTFTPDVDALVKAIEHMLEDSGVPSATYLTDGSPDDLPESVRSVADFYAPAALIDNDGHPRWPSHAQLAEAGYPVHCGERDSSGWLTGVIRTPKGLVMYG